MSTVFYAPKPPKTVHPHTWAPVDFMHDDELVYPMNSVRQAHQPAVPCLRFLHSVPGKKSLSFELLLRGVFCIGVVDSGATHSFVTKTFCDKHNLSYTSAATHALLADGTTRLPIVGVMWNASLKLHSFSCKQSLLV